jgi:hypothetical protein
MAGIEPAETDGLTLAQALEALQKSGLGASASDVISARVARYSEVSSGNPSSPDRWVWLLVVRGNLQWIADCPGEPTITEASSPASCTWIPATESIVLDYRTGEFLEMWVAASP